MCDIYVLVLIVCSFEVVFVLDLLVGLYLWVKINIENVIYYFFQAEDGIRVLIVTGVQTCALPICGNQVHSFVVSFVK